MNPSRQPRRNNQGFTMVELLIVIVVIAILASVSIIAYNGIQNRAQAAALSADISSIRKSVDLFNVTEDNYPDSISDCPTPTATNLCVNLNSSNTIVYSKVQTVRSTTLPKPTYEVATYGSAQFLYQSPMEMYGMNEFMQYTNLAPAIDKYGLVKYRLDFDMKSANVSSRNVVVVYMQNGSTARYGGLYRALTVSTSYAHYSVEFTPTNNNNATPNSMLAFYGTYSTGNIPYVKNVVFQRVL